MYDLTITGGTVVTTAGECKADLAVAGGRIAAIGAPGTLPAGARTMQADGRHVLPGLVDAHTHLREPGFTHKEDFRSGTMAAAAGGVTTVMAIPNTKPPLTTPDAFRMAVDLASEKSVVDVALFAGASIADPEGVTALDGLGPIGYDLFDDPFQHGSGAWITLLERVRATGRRVAFYLSDKSLQEHARQALDARGATAVERFVGPTTGASEVAAIARIAPLAAGLGVPVVLRAVTTPQGLDFVRQVRRLYPELRLAVEVCVHYLFLTVADLEAMGTRAQLLPPLRTAAEVEALWQGVRDGTVDYLGTDHAPHTAEEKARGDLFRSPPGIIGLETWLPLLLTARAHGRLGLPDVVRLACEAPARTYGLYPRKGTIAVGADADLVVVSLDEQWRVDASRFQSRGDRGPFDGWEMTGRPCLTLVRGQVVMQDGKVDSATRGRLLTPQRASEGG